MIENSPGIYHKTTKATEHVFDKLILRKRSIIEYIHNSDLFLTVDTAPFLFYLTLFHEKYQHDLLACR